MKTEEKNLLLKDLCGRSPYGVKVQYKVGSQLPDIKVFNGKQYDELRTGSYLDDWLKCTFKPYLFPLSSMTKEQKKELDKKFHVIGIYLNNIKICYHSEGYWDTDLEVDFQDWLWLINWLNKNHFDYHGLIEKGLAIDASGLNIY